jgi:Domain of unknown function (DUF4279)
VQKSEVSLLKGTMMPTKTKISFRIMEFKCTHEDITKTLRVQPTMIWSQGEKIRHTSLVHKQNGWSLDVDLEDHADLNAHVEDILHKVHPYCKDLVNTCGEYYAELACVLYIAGDERPEIHFTPQVLKKLVALNAHVDVDLYLLE